MLRSATTIFPYYAPNSSYDLEQDARPQSPVVGPGAFVEDSIGLLLPASPTHEVPSPEPRALLRPTRDEAVSLIRQRLDRGIPIVLPEGHESRWFHASKRAFDLVGALIVLLLLSPILAAVYLALFLTTRGRPFFVQTRVGHLGKPFPMFKFRTMTLDAESRRDEVENEQDGPIFKNRNDARVTRIGRILRSTSLDETPQLLNVLLGHMSLVGPRPAIAEEVAQYAPWQRRRLAVKPGLTCLWQVSGRSEIGFEDWMRMDLWYVQNQKWTTDLMLLVRTPWSVLTGRGAY